MMRSWLFFVKMGRSEESNNTKLRIPVHKNVNNCPMHREERMGARTAVSALDSVVQISPLVL